MQYSLLIKFQGALLGAVLGNNLGYYFEYKQIEKERKNYKISINKHKFYPLDLEKQKLQKWVEITVNCANSLIINQEFNQEDWQKVYGQWQDNWANKKDQSSKTSQVKYPQKKAEKFAEIIDNKLPGIHYMDKDDVFYPTASNVAIASLPVTLLYHEDEFKLEQKLEQWGKVWQNYSDINPSNLTIGYVIAQALTEQLYPQTIIPKIIDYIGEKEPLVGQLRQVEQLIDQGANLNTAITQLSKNVKSFSRQQIFSEQQENSISYTFFIPICLALYCFLSTPEDLNLAILRAARTKWATQICTIVGTLSGAYNSTAGIPVEWRQKMGGEPLGINEAEIMNVAKKLWAVWCGVYDQNNMTQNIVPAVAASNVIRPRPRKASGY
ncbi:MAG: ADP-ribosylglycohydrolase family protein [Okeania sp. SIO3B5]|uniref:ADP-ribosylglycohydrolase family protein n=1 Tax=Okeania sp. SIO3B5 TaxID=2607811 RepID=UPI001400AA4C|nr:ADP-ribosylglycohydrolase family protein [Okeania sp. SIO3B5]NEO57173.1 ADP-ribosylglycohydrolase family protein [Okeania sp. SIO3B5]